MGIKGDFEYYEDDNGNVHKLKKLASEPSPEFQDFPRGIAFKRLSHDFDDNFKDKVDYGNDKLLNNSKSKRTIKFKKKGFKKNPYNDNRPNLGNYV